MIVTTQRRNFIVVGLMLGMLLAALDQTIASTAMPTVIGELGGLSRITWVTTAYMLASTAIVPIVGKLADMYGRRRWYLLGMAIFIIGSALCGTSKSMTELILYRGVQGIGGGMLMPIAQTIIGDLFPGPARAKMQGVFGAVFGMSSILGPKLGGWIVDSVNWRWIFYMNLPLGILAAAVIAVALKESTSNQRGSVDYLGSLSMAAGTCLVLLGLMQGGQDYAWSSWQIISMLGGGALLWIAFVVIQTKVAEPILDLSLFKNRVFVVSNAVIFLMGLGMMGALVFIPLFMQGVVGVSANEAGSTMTPMMLAMIGASVIGGRLLLKINYRTQMVVGMLIMAVGFYLMSTLSPETTRSTVMIFMAVIGIGMGMVMPTTTIAVQSAFPAEKRGVVTSATAFFRSIGSTLGITILGVVMNNRASTLLTTKTEPLFASVPPTFVPALAPLQEMMKTEPQSLFGMLLRPNLLEMLPEAMRGPMVAILKDSMAGSLHRVFLVGMALVAAGAVVAVFIGKERLVAAGSKAEAPATAMDMGH